MRSLQERRGEKREKEAATTDLKTSQQSILVNNTTSCTVNYPDTLLAFCDCVVSDKVGSVLREGCVNCYEITLRPNIL